MTLAARRVGDDDLLAATLQDHRYGGGPGLPVSRLHRDVCTDELRGQRGGIAEVEGAPVAVVQAVGAPTSCGPWAWKPVGGVRTRLRNQMKRLFNTHVRLVYEDKHGEQFVNSLIAERGEFWWNPKRPDEPALWESKTQGKYKTCLIARERVCKVTECRGGSGLCALPFCSPKQLLSCGG